MRPIDADAIKYCTERQCFGHGDYGDVMRAYKEDIDKMPTIDPSTLRPTGRWEPRTDVVGFVRCSVCHDCNVYDDWADGKKWNYCPNCGAKMEG